VGAALFEDIEEYQPEDRQKLLKAKEDTQALAVLVSNAHTQYKQFDELAKRRKVGAEDSAVAVPGGSVEAAAQEEQRVVAQQEEEPQEKEAAAATTRRKATLQKLKDESKARLRAKGPAGSSARLATTKKDKDGDDAMGDGIFRMCEAHVAEKDNPKESMKDPFQGVSAVNVHTRNGSLVLISAHLLPKHGLGGADFDRVKSLTAVAQSITDPWATLADWNIPDAKMESINVTQKIGGGLLRPDVEVTCDKGKSSLIDYGVARAQPDATSKRTLKRQEAAGRKKESLESHLHDMFDEEPTEQETFYVIPLVMWQQVLRDGTPHFSSTEEMKANGDYLYHAREDHKVQEGAVTTMYGNWVSAVGSASLATSKLDEHQHHLYQGRKKQQPCKKELKVEVHHLRDMGWDEVFGKNITKSERGDYYMQLDTAENSTVDKLKDLFNTTERQDTFAQARGLTAQRQQFTRWAKQMWSSKPGALHRHVKDKAETRFELTINLERQAADPDTDPVDTTDQSMADLAQLWKEAQEEDLSELTVDQIDMILNSASDAKAMGFDGIGPG
ncbi:unnamed protein product, partial [Prorocentrum cordatum]